MTKLEKITTQIELLESFTPVIAYTGELNNIKQESFISYGEFLIRLNQLKKEYKEINKHIGSSMVE